MGKGGAWRVGPTPLRMGRRGRRYRHHRYPVRKVRSTLNRNPKKDRGFAGYGRNFTVMTRSLSVVLLLVFVAGASLFFTQYNRRHSRAGGIGGDYVDSAECASCHPTI